MTRLRFIWPVYGFTEQSNTQTIAHFFEQGDAADFAMHPERYGFEKRNLYIGEPRYDRRKVHANARRIAA